MQGLTISPKDISSLPSKPGVYQFFNKNRKIIYVGKAKDLKKRVSSYFRRSLNQGRKTAKLVREIDSIAITLVNTEFDAFHLENSLIKENQPKYNILLKDDKTFPFICLTNERFPRVFSTRKVFPGQGTYFGPYASVRAMNNVLELIRGIYHVRTCSYSLTEKNIANGKFKVCLEYHIGKCKGPCEDLQNEEDYNLEISQVVNILKGDIKPVKDHFINEMTKLASSMEFEKADLVKQRYLLLEKFQSRTLIVNPKISNTDVFTIVTENDKCYINYLKIQNGSINQSVNIEAIKKLNEQDEEILLLYIIELRKKFNSNSREVLTNTSLEADLGIEFLVPQIGDKKKLVDLSLKNALYYKKERNTESVPYQNRALEQLMKDLRLKSQPHHIECFDNSNIQGHDPVASMVCFKHGKPSKKDYRKFTVKSVIGPNDFASMKEIVKRRYSRLLQENQSLPDLIVVDGGKGQLNAAIEALHELNIYSSIPIIGIAKRLEEIYFPNDQIPIHLDKKSLSLKLLQHLRNEAHRFAITFHRKRREKRSVRSELDNIPGIGPETKRRLLTAFRSVSKIRNADVYELGKLIGDKKAQILADHLKKRG
jgi:excinuclease ABC subunit C